MKKTSILFSKIILIHCLFFSFLPLGISKQWAKCTPGKRFKKAKLFRPTHHSNIIIYNQTGAYGDGDRAIAKMVYVHLSKSSKRCALPDMSKYTSSMSSSSGNRKTHYRLILAGWDGTRHIKKIPLHGLFAIGYTKTATNAGACFYYINTGVIESREHETAAILSIRTPQNHSKVPRIGGTGDYEVHNCSFRNLKDANEEKGIRLYAIKSTRGTGDPCRYTTPPLPPECQPLPPPTPKNNSVQMTVYLKPTQKYNLLDKNGNKLPVTTKKFRIVTEDAGNSHAFFKFLSAEDTPTLKYAIENVELKFIQPVIRRTKQISFHPYKLLVQLRKSTRFTIDFLGCNDPGLAKSAVLPDYYARIICSNPDSDTCPRNDHTYLQAIQSDCNDPDGFSILLLGPLQKYAASPSAFQIDAEHNHQPLKLHFTNRYLQDKQYSLTYFVPEYVNIDKYITLYNLNHFDK